MEQLEYNLLFRWFVGIGMDECGCRRRSPRIGIGCLTVISRGPSLKTSWRRPGDAACCPLNTFHSRRNVAGGVGPEEFQTQGSAQWPARRSGEPDDQFSQGTALESDASVDDRSRQPIVQEGDRRRSQARVSGRSPDGEPARTGRRRLRRPRDRHRGTRCRDESHRRVAPPETVTIGGDKGYDTRGFVETLRTLDATPHVALKMKSRTLDRRTTRHPWYAISQRARKRIEKATNVRRELK